MEISTKEEKKERTSLAPEELEYKIKIATQTLDHNLRFVANCDTKTSIVLSTVGIVSTIVFAKYAFNEILYHIIKRCIALNNFFSNFCLVLFAAAILIVLLGIFTLASVLIATISKGPSEESADRKEEISLTFFSGILKSGDSKTYRDRFYDMSREELLDDLIKQIYINSEIAARKYKKYNMGLKYVLTGISLFAVSLIIGVYLYL